MDKRNAIISTLPAIMKRTITILLIIISGVSFGQIQPGEYYSYGRYSSGEKMRFLSDNHFQFIIGNDTVGGLGTERNGMLVASKYVIDSTKTPNWIDLIFYDKKTGSELKSAKGLYLQVDNYTIDLALNMSSSTRPKEINHHNPDIMRLTLNSKDNYVKLLLINEKDSIKGFVPETFTKPISSNKNELTYLQDGKPILYKEFQTKEIQTFDDTGRLIARVLYDKDNNLFINQFGYCKQLINYNVQGKITLREFYKNTTELIDYNGTLYPKVEYTYNNGVLDQINRLINNDSLKLIKPSTTKFIYDSFGDQIDWEEYFSNGTIREDTLKVLLTAKLATWINNYALYPKSLDFIIFGKPHKWHTMRSYEKVIDSENYDFYTEFYLNGSSNTKQKFTGFFQFDYNYDVIGIADKSEKTGSGQNLSWGTIEFDNWMKKFGRELTEAEVEKRKLKDKQQLEEVLKTFEEAIDGNNPDVRIEGDIDKKALKKTRKTLKKATRKKN